MTARGRVMCDGCGDYEDACTCPMQGMREKLAAAQLAAVRAVLACMLGVPVADRVDGEAAAYAMLRRVFGPHGGRAVQVCGDGVQVQWTWDGLGLEVGCEVQLPGAIHNVHIEGKVQA